MFKVLLNYSFYTNNIKNYFLILYLLIFLCSTPYFTDITFAMYGGVDFKDWRIGGFNAFLGELKINYRDSNIFCINEYRQSLHMGKSILTGMNVFNGGDILNEKFYNSVETTFTYFNKDVNICYGYESDLLNAIKKLKK